MTIDVKRYRRDFPALENYIWFQNGGVSITPLAVATEHRRRMDELLTRGPMHIVYPDEEYPRRRESMARLAAFFGVEAADLALMRGVSEAFQTVLRGLEWRAGDRIVISAEEEAALLLPCLHLQQRFGVEVVKLPLLVDQAKLEAAVDQALSTNTRLLALSHVTTDIGFRFRVERICQLAQERGVLSFLDMAHSAGLYPIDLSQVGCDFAGLLSYKWMYSPYAAGALYVQPNRLDDLNVTYAGGRAEQWLDFEEDRFALHDSAERFQYGPWSWPLVHAWARGAEYLQEVGLEALWARTVALTQRLKQGLKRIKGAQLYTPEAADFSAALVSFGLQGWKGQLLAEQLRHRWNMIIKPLPHSREGLRASLPFFIEEREVDLLLEALAQLAEQA